MFKMKVCALVAIIISISSVLSEAQNLPPDVLWSAAVDSKVRSEHAWKTAAILEWGYAVHKENPHMKNDEILDAMRFNEHLTSGVYDEAALAGLQKISSVNAAAVGAEWLEPVIPFLSVGAKAYAEKALPPPTEIDWFRAYQNAPVMFYFVRKNAEADPQFAALTDEWLGTRISNPPPVMADSNAILSRDPGLQFELQSRVVQDELEHARRDIADHSETLDKEIATITEAARRNAATALATKAHDSDIKGIKDDAMERRLAFDLYTNLFAFSGDPKIAKAVNSANAVIQPLISFDESLKLFDKGEVSTLMLASSGMSVALAAQALLGPGKDASPELAEVKSLLVDIRKDIQEGFKHVDEKLDEVLRQSAETVELLRQSARTEQGIESTLTRQNEKLDEIYSAIIDISRQLAERDASMAKYSCEKARERFGKITDDEWRHCLSYYMASADTSSEVPDEPKPSLGALALRLRNSPNTHIALLLREMRGLRGEDDAIPVVRNSYRWSLASRDYLAFADTWPMRSVPQGDLKELADTGSSIVNAQQDLLGKDRVVRNATIKGISAVIRGSEERLSNKLESFYAEEKTNLILKDSKRRLETFSLKPCPAGVTTDFLRYPGWRSGPPTLTLDAPVMNRISPIYLSNAGGFMPSLSFCYSKAWWGPPEGINGSYSTSTARLTIEIRSGTTLVKSSDVAVSSIVGAFDWAINCNPEMGIYCPLRTSISQQIGSWLITPTQEYLEAATAAFDKNDDARKLAWENVAQSKANDGDLIVAAEDAGTYRNLVEQTFQVGGAPSLTKRPQLRELLLTNSSLRLPDKEMISGMLNCLSSSDNCSPTSAISVRLLLSKGLPSLFGQRLTALSTELDGVASKDDLNQADPSSAIALSSIVVHQRNRNRATEVAWLLMLLLALVILVTAVLVWKKTVVRKTIYTLMQALKGQH